MQDQLHAHARLNDIDNKKTDDQGNGGDNLKVKKRQTARFTTFFMSSIPAIPVTTVQKITGAMII